MLALTLLLAAPKFELVETIERDRYFKIMGSPKGDAFYIVDHFEHGETPRMQIFRKTPNKEPELLESYEDQVRFQGTDANGKPVLFRGGTSAETHTVDSNGPQSFHYRFTVREARTLDSGVVTSQFGEANITLFGPLRRSLREYPPSSRLLVSSVAVLTTQPLFLSCDGNDHLITVTTNREKRSDPFTFTLYRWGEELNTLIAEKTFTLPKQVGNEEFHVKALATASVGKCYVVYETWKLKQPYKYENIAKRSILCIDIGAQTQQTVADEIIPGPDDSASDGPPYTEFVELYAIQTGQFLAVWTSKKTSIYHRIDAQ